MSETISATYRYLLVNYSPLLTLKRVDELMHTTPNGACMAIARKRLPFALALASEQLLLLDFFWLRRLSFECDAPHFGYIELYAQNCRPPEPHHSFRFSVFGKKSYPLVMNSFIPRPAQAMTWRSSASVINCCYAGESTGLISIACPCP